MAETTEKNALKSDKFKDVTIVREGNQIILPDGMSFDDGMEWLRRKKVEEDRTVAINEQIDAFPLDGAYAFWRAISRKYGFAGLIPTPGFWGPTPPAMIGVATGPNESVQVPWGRIQIPNISGHLDTYVDQKDGRQIFVIGGEVRQKHKKAIADLAQMTRDIVKEESIYRGRAIKVSFPPLNPKDYNPTSNQPKFLEISKIKEEELVFSKGVKVLVQDSLFTPIEKTKQCRQYKIPLKRGILLEGPYGTGKTQTAYVTAKKCVDNKWTFIYLDSVKSLPRAIFFAQQYGPAVIFAEDIDQVLKGDTRTDEMNAILNTIDGVDSKDHELIVVLTTNHVELINPAMLRPGRLDAVIPVRPPDGEAVTRLLRLYARGLVSDNENLDEVGRILKGHIPAVIREVVERSKLSAVTRLEDGKELHLVEEDLVAAAHSMLAQTELLNPNPKETPHPMELFGKAMGREVAFGVLTVSKTTAELKQLLGDETVDSFLTGKKVLPQVQQPVAATAATPKRA